MKPLAKFMEHESDSEDDEDYVPPADDGSNSSEDESDKGSDAKKDTQEDDTEKKDLKKVWESFQASIAQEDASQKPPAEPNLVKVVKRYRFAGEEHEEVIEVPEGSDDAKRWPLYHPTDLQTANSQSEPRLALQPSSSTKDESVHASPAPAHVPPPDTTIDTTTSIATQTVKSEPPPPKRKPGPRKPKTTLAPLPGSSGPKAKKITTLEKSAIDWKSHLESQKGTGVQEELEANRRGGGYLEKVEFLQRVEERKDEHWKAARSAKRRKI
ncbi:hypothetical protein CC1G_05292 [Coprinopsis cinerea okayama7|uniref:SWR1-complex protein 5 n=1 Tax=Coprinopsis cinerea (strain Okayama-7 / 130 / ATCC MYA-4618 / FGSC 9003) TaxID=240176 RepID=A8PCI3_COPC7|nr:hypothetical protein CC1G_05292 [Coprinopsis cinerea okayama7\|eukprot:XP_001840406.1 hypothetical protein CC1G_05292 [Coprinopsis cinerea okayama7\